MEVISAFILASMLLTIAPGPDMLMVISLSLEKGFFSAFRFILGLTTGLLGHTLLLVLGWAQFIGERPNLVDSIKIIACSYFLFLGLLSIRSFFLSAHPKKNKQVIDRPFRQGVLMNLLNPKVSLFFWMFFPGFLFHSSLATALQYAVLGLLFLLQALLIFSLVALFASRITLYSKSPYTTLFTGALWIVLGLYMLRT